MTINLQHITSKAALHKLFQQHMMLPAWYGHNWDAFWDAITGLVELPAEVRLVGWQEFAAACPQDMLILRELIDEYAQARPSHRIVLT